MAMKSLSGFLGGAMMKRKGYYKLCFMNQEGMKVCETWLDSKRVKKEEIGVQASLRTIEQACQQQRRVYRGTVH